MLVVPRVVPVGSLGGASRVSSVYREARRPVCVAGGKCKSVIVVDVRDCRSAVEECTVCQSLRVSRERVRAKRMGSTEVTLERAETGCNLWVRYGEAYK